MPEYGREIQKMIDYAITLPEKEDRQRCAEAIINQMSHKAPQLRNSEEFIRTLWDHLYLMSYKLLDIDWPFDISEAEKLQSKPEPIKIPQEGNYLRYYGKLVKELLQKLKEMPAGEERDELTRMTANQMKRDLMTWGHGSIDDEKVIDDIARMTDGVIQLDLDIFKSLGMRSMASEPKKQIKKKK